LEDGGAMDSEQVGPHVVTESLIGAQDGPSMHASVGYPHVIIKLLLDRRAIHRP
jgi:hypothetical protein